MSQYAKSIVAAVAAVLIAGIQAWQTAVDGAGFRLIDILPIAVALVGAFLTYLVPEVPELTRAKTWVAGAFAILTALATFATGHPADVTVLNLIVAGLGALVTSYVPNLAPEASAAIAVGSAAAKATAGQKLDAQEITDVLRQVEQLDPAVAAKDPVAAAAVPVSSERQVVADALAQLSALDAAATPIYDQVAAAPTAIIPAQPGATAEPVTQPVQAVTPGAPAVVAAS